MNELKIGSIKLRSQITNLVFKTKILSHSTNEEERIEIIGVAQKFKGIKILEVDETTWVLKEEHFQQMIKEISLQCKNLNQIVCRTNDNDPKNWLHKIKAFFTVCNSIHVVTIKRYDGTAKASFTAPKLFHKLAF